MFAENVNYFPFWFYGGLPSVVDPPGVHSCDAIIFYFFLEFCIFWQSLPFDLGFQRGSG